MRKEIIFVYNAKSNAISKYLDFAHKIISPSTYTCDLCSLTHGNFEERKIWTEYRKNSIHELKFLYKDEYEKNYKKKQEYPFIGQVIKTSSELEILIDAKTFKKIGSIEELITLLNKKK